MALGETILIKRSTRRLRGQFLQCVFLGRRWTWDVTHVPQDGRWPAPPPSSTSRGHRRLAGRGAAGAPTCCVVFHAFARILSHMLQASLKNYNMNDDNTKFTQRGPRQQNHRCVIIARRIFKMSQCTRKGETSWGLTDLKRKTRRYSQIGKQF